MCQFKQDIKTGNCGVFVRMFHLYAMNRVCLESDNFVFAFLMVAQSCVDCVANVGGSEGQQGCFVGLMGDSKPASGGCKSECFQWSNWAVMVGCHCCGAWFVCEIKSKELIIFVFMIANRIGVGLVSAT